MENSEASISLAPEEAEGAVTKALADMSLDSDVHRLFIGDISSISTSQSHSPVTGHSLSPGAIYGSG